jgi:predicted ribosome quality control (RQC) complex YloA/Tae2 family protein
VQPVDYTTLVAVCADLRSQWLPARCEQVIQLDRYTICLLLRTLQAKGWLTISWHPQAARIHIGQAPPRRPDTFAFSQQLKHQFNHLALTQINFLAPWERVIDLQFAQRPNDAPQWHLYLEIMGKYSNCILTNAQQTIVTAAHQVSEQQSSVRPIRTGNPYEHPPSMRGVFPKKTDSFENWQAHIGLIPGPLQKTLLKAYNGLSTGLIQTLLKAAQLDPHTSTDALSQLDWQRLFVQWQHWLHCLEMQIFAPQALDHGYRVIGLADSGLDASSSPQPSHSPTPPSIQTLLDDYYRHQLNRQVFSQLHHQLAQRLKVAMTKLSQKAQVFTNRLQESTQAEHYRTQADLLMAYLHQWQPGMTQIELADFETGAATKIPLDPEKNAVQNAQAFYKQHQKLKRASDAVRPLLQAVTAELTYLEQVEAALVQVSTYIQESDLTAIEEIRDELIQQKYLTDPYNRDTRKADKPNFHRLVTPSGFEVLIGRNNHQNDLLTFKVATDYDLWLHSQEIPGSHVLLRLSPGEVAQDEDLAFAADCAAYFSRARQAEQVPVVYTHPKHVYKPKGERPGMVIYKHERVLWGEPQRAASIAAASIQKAT